MSCVFFKLKLFSLYVVAVLTMNTRLIFILTAIGIQLTCSNAFPVSKSNAIEFLILHNNDMHARFEQTSVSGGKCSEEDQDTNKCYGGFARTAHEIRKFREEAKSDGLPVLYLNAGDTYTGTPWFTVFKDNITAAFLNKLSPDAISLGNHEFDEGVDGLVPFLNEVEFPVLAANLDLSETPELEATKSLAKSVILDVSGIKVGIVGYVTPETKALTVLNNVEFEPEIDAINEEAAKFKSQGINIIIALGHSGYQKDQEIAAKCPEVDIVIGGHTNTFLYNGKQPDAERPEGPYPKVIEQSNGRKVPVVQAYAYTKYLGKLHVQFDSNGNLIEFDGQPILLDADIPRDSDILDLLNVYRPKIMALEKAIVGYTKVYLEGHSSVCRVTECNLGNLIADSLVYARTYQDAGGKYWTDAAIGLVQGGGIRNSIEKRSDGTISENDILAVMPFSNDVYIVKVSGKTIRNALEHSAEIYDSDSNGGFLQMSGLRVVYNAEMPVGQRVVSAEALCTECEVPFYSELEDAKMYNVIISEFLLKGGDGHKFDENKESSQRLPNVDSEVLSAFIKARQIVYPALEGRITWIEGKGGSSVTVRSSILTLAVVFLLRKLLN